MWIFSVHLCHHQLSRGRAASLESPAGSYAWHLQRSQQVLGAGKMTMYGTSSRGWGMVDPVSNRPYRKPQRFACSESLASLNTKCQCKRQGKKHQTVQGHATGHGRSFYLSGAYPSALATAFAQIIWKYIQGHAGAQ